MKEYFKTWTFLKYLNSTLGILFVLMSLFSKKTTYIPIYFFSFGFFVLLVTILTKNRYQRIALIFNVIFYYKMLNLY